MERGSSAESAAQAGLDGLSFDRALTRLVEQAQTVLSAQNRLRSLLRATEAIVGDLSLPTVLRGIVEAACELVGAPYGALGVLTPDGVGLDQFIHVGIPEAEAEKIGHLPQGKGLLGALIVDPHTVRLADLTIDYRSVGFPEAHPPMRSFLGTPIKVREEVFGNLYLANVGGIEFSVEDEQLISALAATAGIAIANARLYAEAEHRQQWLQASTDATREILSGGQPKPYRMLCERVRQLADADLVTVVEPAGDEVAVVDAVGTGAKGLKRTRYPRNRTISGHTLETGEPHLVRDARDSEEVAGRLVHVASALPVGPMMTIPLTTATGARAALTAARTHDRAPFTTTDMEMATTYVTHAAIAIELAEARQLQEQMTVVEDRDRIAEDLNHNVIEQLFAIGMRLTNLRSTINAPAAATLGAVTSSLDDTIRQMRTAVFGLQDHKTAQHRQTGTS